MQVLRKLEVIQLDEKSSMPSASACVAGQLQHLRVRVFPPDTPAVMRSIKVRDG
jgi:hypothetical protein